MHKLKAALLGQAVASGGVAVDVDVIDDAANNEHAGRLGHIGLRRPTWVESSALQEEANDDSAPAASAAKKTFAMLKAAGEIKHSDAPLPRRICPAAYCHQVMK